MLLFTDHGAPIITCKGKDLGEQRFSLNEFIAVKGVKARGKRLSTDARAKVTLADTPDPNLQAAAAEAEPPVAATDPQPVAAEADSTAEAAPAAPVAPPPAPKAPPSSPDSGEGDFQNTLF